MQIAINLIHSPVIEFIFFMNGAGLPVLAFAEMSSHC